MSFLVVRQWKEGLLLNRNIVQVFAYSPFSTYKRFSDIDININPGMASRKYLHLLKKSGNLLGVSGCVILGYVLYDKYKKEGNVYASWTTNFEPSVKWDANWDRYLPVFSLLSLESLFMLLYIIYFQQFRDDIYYEIIKSYVVHGTSMIWAFGLSC